MNVPDHASSRSHSGLDAVQPYTMHVSARYLDLTRRKLEVTRLPRELPTNAPAWADGTPKSVLEPLLDYWLEQYDWRAQEAALNNRLPQFRCTIDPPTDNDNSTTATATSAAEAPRAQRIHFVHKRCQTAHALPLLYCHSWPGSFLEVSKIIDGLSEPYFAAVPPGSAPPLGFHVVAPSIPGFGFSDAPTDPEFGLAQTAYCFDALMKQLGYDQYLVHGSEHGFAIARMLCLKHASSCVAVHTISPRFPSPQLKRSYAAALRYQMAYLTGARYERLAFGYTPSEVTTASTRKAPTHRTPDLYESYLTRHQTSAFSLTDSPAGLLACVLDTLRPHTLEFPSKPPHIQPRPTKPPSASSSRSNSIDNVRRTAADPFMEPIRESIESGLSLLQLMKPAGPTWTPDEVLNWTMMMWLPGPEGGLRWLHQVMDELSADSTSALWACFSHVPLGISTFRPPIAETAEPPPRANNAGVETRATSIQTAPLCWWSKLGLGAASRTKSAKTRLPSHGGDTTETVRPPSPPSWATTYQRLEWVCRHDTAVRLPIWEVADQVVVDIRDCFGSMLERGLIESQDPPV